MDPQPDSVAPLTASASVARMAGLIDRALSAGDRAALRRMKPSEVACSAFWRLMALGDVVWPGDAHARDLVERRWACIAQSMALMAGLHAPSIPLGKALAEAGVSELRLLRLLRSSDLALADAVRVVSTYLAQKVKGSDHREVAALVLSDGRSDSEAVRRSIARSFYYQQSKES